MLLITDDMIFDWCYFLNEKYNISMVELITNQQDYIPGISIDDIYEYPVSNLIKNINQFNTKKIVAISIDKPNYNKYIETISNYLDNYELILYTETNDLMNKIKKFKIECVLTLNYNLALELILKSSLKNCMIMIYSNRIFNSINLKTSENELVTNLLTKKIKVNFIDREMIEEDIEREARTRGMIE